MKIFKILLVLLLSCGALHVQASSEEEPPAEGEEAAAAAKPGFSYHALDPDIITNYLSDSKTLGYIRVTVELMAENEADLKLLEQHDPLIRDAIIRLIGSKNADQVKSLTNREELLTQTRHFQRALQAFEAAIQNGDPATLENLIENASHARATWRMTAIKPQS